MTREEFETLQVGEIIEDTDLGTILIQEKGEINIAGYWTTELRGEVLVKKTTAPTPMRIAYFYPEHAETMEKL